jgi:hypothetical protein
MNEAANWAASVIDSAGAAIGLALQVKWVAAGQSWDSG